MTKVKLGQKFADLHPDRRGRVVVVEDVCDQFFDSFTEVLVRSNRDRWTHISYEYLTTPYRFRPLSGKGR